MTIFQDLLWLIRFGGLKLYSARFSTYQHDLQQFPPRSSALSCPYKPWWLFLPRSFLICISLYCICQEIMEKLHSWVNACSRRATNIHGRKCQIDWYQNCSLFLHQYLKKIFSGQIICSVPKATSVPLRHDSRTFDRTVVYYIYPYIGNASQTWTVKAITKIVPDR